MNKTELSNNVQRLRAWYKMDRFDRTKRRELLCVMIETDGNQAACARELGISRPTVRAWIRNFHIQDWEWQLARQHWNIQTTEPGAITWWIYPVMDRG